MASKQEEPAFPLAGLALAVDTVSPTIDSDQGVDLSLSPATPPTYSTAKWNPLDCPDWDLEKPTQSCILRIQRDISNLISDPAPGILVIPEEEDITRLHALIVGPEDTPYENGFFHFFVRIPPTYPLAPPRVRLMTTDDGRVRFNPNLYPDGKVCMSILGTWGGPEWRATQTLSSVLISIQSLLTANPYHNEPGFEQEQYPGVSEVYNRCIQHETLRVAVCGLIEKRESLPKMIRLYLESQFSGLCESYRVAATEKLNLDGQSFRDPFNFNRGRFNFQAIIDRLQALEKLLATEPMSDSDPESDVDVDDSTSEMPPL